MSELEQVLDERFKSICQNLPEDGDLVAEIDLAITEETNRSLSIEEKMLFADWRDVLEEPGTDWSDLMRWLWHKIKQFIDWLKELLD